MGSGRRCWKVLRRPTGWCCRKKFAMTLTGEIFLQTFRNLWSHKLRSMLTMFGISWGIAAIIFMIAIGEGFKAGYRNMIYTMGTDIVIFWPGRTSLQAGGQRSGHDVH